MIDLNLNPNRKELRQFSIALIVATAAVGGILWWQIGPNVFSKGLWVGGPIAGLIGLTLPIAMKPLFIVLSIVAFPIGIVIGTLALALVYYGLITPIGLVFKLVGRDLMTRKLDPEATSHWVERKPRPGAERYFQQF